MITWYICSYSSHISLRKMNMAYLLLAPSMTSCTVACKGPSWSALLLLYQPMRHGWRVGNVARMLKPLLPRISQAS